MKENQIRELVNELRDIAVEYHGTQQLRERIARTVRAAMLQMSGNSEQLNQAPVKQPASNESVSETYKLPPNSFTDAELHIMAHGDNPQSNAYRELLAFRRNSPVAAHPWRTRQ